MRIVAVFLGEGGGEGCFLLKKTKQFIYSFSSCDIKYTEGLQSFNWPKIMKTIVDDPEGFFDQGGWTFLEPESDSESKDADDDISDEEDDAYEPTESESEEDSDDDASDYSEEDDDDSDSDSGSGSGSGSDESGKDWSELEEEARKEDMENSGDESDHDTKKRKKPIVNIGGKTNGNAAKKPRK
jgi:nucleosome binding factor SPN SPT16 subunit